MAHPVSTTQSIVNHPAFRSVIEAISAGAPATSLAGLTRPAKALAAAGLACQMARPAIVLTGDNETAEAMRRAAATFFSWLDAPSRPAAVATLPAFDALPYDNRSPHPEILERRAVALGNVARGRTRVLFVPLLSALGRFRDRADYGALELEVTPGDEVGLALLGEHLSAVGYERAEPVTAPGQFSLRGGIMDVFSPEAGLPVRIEFFGDLVESLREFDPATQRSKGAIERAVFLPLTQFTRSQTHEAFPGWEFFTYRTEKYEKTLISLFERPLVLWDEPAERRAQLKRILETWAARYDEVRDSKPPPPRPEEVLLREDEFFAAVEAVPQVGLQELALDEATGGENARAFVLRTQPVPKFHGAVQPMMEHVREALKKGWTVHLALPNDGKLGRVREILAEYQVPFVSAGSPGEAEAEGAAVLIRGDLEEGLALPEIGLELLADGDLFGAAAWGRPSAERRDRALAASFISDLSDLKPGDYVVHVDHGIGIYRGLRQLAIGGGPHHPLTPSSREEGDSANRDFMLITYQDEAKLYVPLERLDLVGKYRAAEGAKPVLDRLGGLTWARTKTRVKRALRDMAAELLRLYAERKMRGGRATSADTPWQKEFEDSFEFEETSDQEAALGEIKRDLEDAQPMDRLLCGDVGYGKTELAMRAAFKVVQESRQVAVLAPTTVLAFQHFTTFRQRMAAFPVRIEMLSRFRTPAEMKRVVAETEAGRVDVLIGTHRLLSKDVGFRDLGLLIVDEEQRFGVAAKERLKKLAANVDVLTMSATPIPRTLHMSLGGLRDLSVIETPPRGRLAIQTVVASFSDALIQSAILQEMARQGQVFFVHNRVESIFTMAALIQRLVPTARLGVVHGRMGEKELERVMLKFVEGETDVLVATALIENGLDIPRANTLIVNHAERFGLADLYQLRGRVGRSDRRAYAYFLVPSEDALSPSARKRLAALKEFSDLGAGFRLAALDLELRGAGNLLGAEQSGHLNAIGIDLYLQMLEETVQELKGAPARPEVRTTLNLGLDIKIPTEYVADESQRLRMYKRVSSMATSNERAELELELKDRYGPIPSSVRNLLNYAILRSEAEGTLVQSIERKGDDVWLRFHERAPVSAERLAEFLRRHSGAQFRPDGTLRFRLAAPDEAVPERIASALREVRAPH